MLRRFQSEPLLANPRLESGNFKIKSDLRQSILYRHKQITPMSDKRHPIRSTNLAQKQPPTGKISLMKKKKFFLNLKYFYFFSSNNSVNIIYFPISSITYT